MLIPIDAAASTPPATRCLTTIFTSKANKESGARCVETWAEFIPSLDGRNDDAGPLKLFNSKSEGGAKKFRSSVWSSFVIAEMSSGSAAETRSSFLKAARSVSGIEEPATPSVS